MSKYIFIILFVLGICLFSCSNSDNTNDENTTEDDTNISSDFYKRAEIDTDKDFKALMLEDKQSPDRVAPLTLRNFLNSLEVYRIELHTAFKMKSEKISFSWWMGEVAVEDSYKVVKEKIINFFKNNGFESLQTDDEFEFSYERQHNNLLERVKIVDLFPFTGKANSCGFGMYYEITFPDIYNEKEFTLNKVFKIHPNLVCPELPESIIDEFGERPVDYVNYGGTWQRFYTISISFPIQTETETKILGDKLIDLLKVEGFALDSDINDEELRYRNQSGAFAYVEIDIVNNKLYFRLQPYSS
jgi:hypothetical protein